LSSVSKSKVKLEIILRRKIFLYSITPYGTMPRLWKWQSIHGL